MNLSIEILCNVKKVLGTKLKDRVIHDLAEILEGLANIVEYNYIFVFINHSLQ